jgi:hypothetical protein
LNFDSRGGDGFPSCRLDLRAVIVKQRLPITPTLVAAYRDLGRLLTAMRALMMSAFLIMLAISAAADFVPQRLWDQELAGEALGLAQNAIEAFLLTPVVVAIHRFVILDKITPNYTLPVGDPVFRIFFSWLLALEVLLGLPFDLLGVLQTLNWSLSAITLAFALALIAAVGVALRLTILLPALAVGAPGATASHAAADTKGHVLRILALFVLALVPWLAAAFGGVLLLGRGAMITGSPLAMLSLVMGGVLQTITLALTVVIASYAFMALAAQVKRAPHP